MAHNVLDDPSLDTPAKRCAVERAAQGLPLQVQDPAVLAAAAARIRARMNARDRLS